MISQRQLHYWIDFLAEQIVALQNLHSKKAGSLNIGSPEVVAFLQTNDAVGKDQVEAAIARFARENVWPPGLKADHIVNLTHRATMAHGLLTMILNGQFIRVDALQVPKFEDRIKFLQWLLVDLWGYGGAPYLEGLSNSYFVDTPKVTGNIR
jgi:hypothetical protein